MATSESESDQGMGKFLHRHGVRLALGIWLLFSAHCALAANTLAWDTKQNRISADIKSEKLFTFLERVASATRWKVFVEPEASHNVSAKFNNLSTGEALALLLGDLNFALVPETNGPSRLYVFRTVQQNATQLIKPSKAGATSGKHKIIPNELIVRLRPGANIDEIAKLVGAKVVGKIDGLNAYRLQFEDEESANAARAQLENNNEVASVENNYAIDRPPGASPAPGLAAAPINLQLKPPPDSGQIVIGLIDSIDSEGQPLCNNLNQFLLKPINVAGKPQLDPNTPSHGASMAETMLRSLQAVTKGSTSVQILPVDVYGSNPSSSTFDVAQGVVQAVNGGAKIINLSLGGEGESPVLHDVIKSVQKLNIPVFAAAGNEPVTTPFYPAAYPEVTAVTAIDHGQIAPYANRGSFVALGAPGAGVFCFNGQSYYAVGTSTSAAFTSGLAAGYMDATHSTVSQMQGFLQNNLAVPK